MVSKWIVVPRISNESSFMPSHLALDISVNSAFLKHPISLQRMEWEISQCCWTGDRSPLISVLKLFAGTWDQLQMPDKVGCWDLVSALLLKGTWEARLCGAQTLLRALSLCSNTGSWFWFSSGGFQKQRKCTYISRRVLNRKMKITK